MRRLDKKRRSARRVAVAASIAAIAVLGFVGCDRTYVFNSIEIGDDKAERARTAVSNAQFIRTVFADVLGRAPEVREIEVESADSADSTDDENKIQIDEQRSLVDALDSVGDPDPLRAVIVAGLLRSAEAALPEKAEVVDPRGFIREQFRRFLGREPGFYELTAFEAEWKADPAVGPRSVVRALIGSREYQSR